MVKDPDLLPLIAESQENFNSLDKLNDKQNNFWFLKCFVNTTKWTLNKDKYTSQRYSNNYLKYNTFIFKDIKKDVFPFNRKIEKNGLLEYFKP